MADHLHRHLAALAEELGDRSAVRAIENVDRFDGYVRQAMVLLDAAYGPECARIVRTASAGPVSHRRPWPRRVALGGHRYIQDWHLQLLAAADA